MFPTSDEDRAVAGREMVSRSRGHVQAIKRPTLIEINGPLMMSHLVVSNVQYRLSEEPGGTLIKFHHTALGVIQGDHRQGFPKGLGHIFAKIKERTEAGRLR